MEIMEKYENYQKEVKKHFDKYQETELCNLFLKLRINDWFKENYQKEDFSFRVDANHGNPMISCNGSMISMAFAAYLLMNARDDFWHMFDIVMTIKEFMEMNANVEHQEIQCDTKEQMDILSKLQSMSPEELSAIKEKIINGPEKS